MNSLGLTEQQPENNVHRILIEMLAVTLSKRARAPARGPAAGLERGARPAAALGPAMVDADAADPRLRDRLLEYDDIFDGSTAIDAKVEAPEDRDPGGARPDRRARRRGDGDRDRPDEAGARRIERQAHRRDRARRAGRGRRQQVPERRALAAHAGDGAIFTVSETVEMEAQGRIKAWRAQRDAAAVRGGPRRARGLGPRGPQRDAGLDRLRQGRGHHREWGERLRQVFGEYRAPTGVTPETVTSGRPRRRASSSPISASAWARRPARRRQARPRRPLERRRADRLARPRRRLRRDL